MQCSSCHSLLPSDSKFCENCGSTLIPDPFLGCTLDGKYEILRKIGQGTFGAVYEAHDKRFLRQVAIKSLHPHMISNRQVVKRFLQEGIAASKLEHPCVVKIYDNGKTAEGYFWLAMEFLNGESLEEFLKKTGPLGPEQMIEILGPICESLGEAHRKNLIHRDLKPQNIMLVSMEEKLFPKILDFGIAKLSDTDKNPRLATQLGSSMGTPAYMPPEQWGKASEVVPASDVYSLGVIAYQMLSGKFPLEGDSPRAWMKAHHSVPPKPLAPFLKTYPKAEALSNVMMRALDKNPQNRYPSAQEFKHALEEVLFESTPKNERLQSEENHHPEIPEWLDNLVAQAIDQEQSASSQRSQEKQGEIENDSIIDKKRMAQKTVPKRVTSRKVFYIFLSALLGLVLVSWYFISLYNKPSPSLSKPLAQIEPLPAENIRDTPETLTKQDSTDTSRKEEELPFETLNIDVELNELEKLQSGTLMIKRGLLNGDTVKSGDRFELRITSEQAAYIYVLSLSPDASIAVFPSVGDTQLEPRVTLRLPGKDASGRQIPSYRLDDKIGYENIYVLASSKPLAEANSEVAQFVEKVRSGDIPSVKPERLRSGKQRPIGLAGVGEAKGFFEDLEDAPPPIRKGKKSILKFSYKKKGLHVIHLWLKHKR